MPDIPTFSQNEFDLRCEWGADGVAALAPTSDAVVIVDVLSFCTAVDIAVGRGAVVYPFDGPYEAADSYAASLDAVLAEKDRTARFSLSPHSLTQITLGTRIVLPSPNGSRLSLATGSTPTLAGCLRNFKAVAAAALHFGPRISVIPAGERWRISGRDPHGKEFSSGSLRPAIEDWLGAGAVLSQLSGSISPMARAAVAAFREAEGEIERRIRGCGSGVELIERGFEKDVVLASVVGESATAPILSDGAYRSP